MKKYIQITAGRGPVECARAVALVAREICRAVPGLTVFDTEPHKSGQDWGRHGALAVYGQSIPARAQTEELVCRRSFYR